MKVVLTEDVKGVGKKGEVVEVAKGYGVNFLVRKGFAALATEESIKMAQTLSLKKKEDRVHQKGFISQLSKSVSKRKFEIRVGASKGGTLYGSLSEADLVEHLMGVLKIKDQDVTLKVGLVQPIKDVGKYPLEVTLSGNGEKKTVEVIISVVTE